MQRKLKKEIKAKRQRKEFNYKTIHELEVLKKENFNISKDQSNYSDEFWKTQKPVFDFFRKSLTPLKEKIQKIELPTFREIKEFEKFILTGNLKPIIKLVDEELSWFENIKAKPPRRFYFISPGHVDSVFKTYERYFILCAKREDYIMWWKELLKVVNIPYLPPSSKRDLKELNKKINALIKIMQSILLKPGRPKAPPDFEIRTIYYYLYKNFLYYLQENYPEDIKQKTTPSGKPTYIINLEDADFKIMLESFGKSENIPITIIDKISDAPRKKRSTVTMIASLIIMLKLEIKLSTVRKAISNHRIKPHLKHKNLTVIT